MLETQWFRADLHALRPTDDPRAALAFACARMAFLARVAMLMGWTEPDTAWRVLLLNAQRAHCFDSWTDFGHAYVAGRRQWVAGFRADPFGKAFDDATLGWLAPGGGAWGRRRGRGWRRSIPSRSRNRVDAVMPLAVCFPHRFSSLATST